MKDVIVEKKSSDEGKGEADRRLCASGRVGSTMTEERRGRLSAVLKRRV
jgi:hypothetical protein